jgi:hypothetical protein
VVLGLVLGTVIFYLFAVGQSNSVFTRWTESLKAPRVSASETDEKASVEASAGVDLPPALQQSAEPGADVVKVADDALPEAPPDPETGPRVAPPELVRQEIAEAISGWASAWSGQRVDDYLSFYSEDFRPPEGLTRRQWAASRRERLLRPRRIQVSVGQMRFEDLGSNRFGVSFLQSYASDTFSDRVSKTLELVREVDGWKIVEERAGG